MGLLDKVVLQLQQLYDALDVLIIVGLIYFAVRGRRHLRGVRFGVITLLIMCLAYIVLFAGAASGWVQERYFRPIIPFAAILAAAGYYCLAKDVRKKRVLHIVAAVVLLACLWAMLAHPIRAHRRPQTEAGLWLKRHDPQYKGFVVSSYSQPVFYADMEFFEADGTEDIFLGMVARGQRFKYIILDGDEGRKWYGRYAVENGWQLIYEEDERRIRIYENPGFGSSDG